MSCLFVSEEGYEAIAWRDDIGNADGVLRHSGKDEL